MTGIFSRAAWCSDMVVFAAGALTPLAFAPFGLSPLALLAPAVLFVVWHDAQPTRAAWRGFLYGAGLFGVGVSWVYVSLHTFGNMPAPLAAFTVMLFVALLAAFPAATGWLQARYQTPSPVRRVVLVAPTLWVLLEWIRGWFLTGFPWLNLGYSQTDTALAGWAAWTGVYGISAAVAVSSGLLAAAWIDRRRTWRLYLPIAAAIWALGWCAGQVAWVHPVGAPLPVALIQGNTPLAIKWRPEYRDTIINEYVRLSERAAHARLIVWPEAAVPDYFGRVGPTLVPRLQRIGSERNADFLIGAVERDRKPWGTEYYNSTFAIGHNYLGGYRKRHLVPFGEFLPLPGVLGWLLDYLHIPMSNFTAGDARQALLRVAGHQIGVSICYEDAFGEELITALPQATLFVNVSEDSWFGRSLAPHQRLQMARMRALESGRPMLRAANTGPSAIIDYRGNVLERSPQFVENVLTGSVQPTTGMTPYARAGNVPVVVLMLVLLAVSRWRRRQ